MAIHGPSLTLLCTLMIRRAVSVSWRMQKMMMFNWLPTVILPLSSMPSPFCALTQWSLVSPLSSCNGLSLHDCRRRVLILSTMAWNEESAAAVELYRAGDRRQGGVDPRSQLLDDNVDAASAMQSASSAGAGRRRRGTSPRRSRSRHDALSATGSAEERPGRDWPRRHHGDIFAEEEEPALAAVPKRRPGSSRVVVPPSPEEHTPDWLREELGEPPSWPTAWSDEAVLAIATHRHRPCRRCTRALRVPAGHFSHGRCSREDCPNFDRPRRRDRASLTQASPDATSSQARPPSPRAGSPRTSSSRTRAARSIPRRRRQGGRSTHGWATVQAAAAAAAAATAATAAGPDLPPGNWAPAAELPAAGSSDRREHCEHQQHAGRSIQGAVITSLFGAAASERVGERASDQPTEEPMW